MNPVISLIDVGVCYKRHGNIFRKPRSCHALKSVSLDVFPGETLGVIGKNGSGKTTLLRVLSNVIRPDTGTIENHGASVKLLALQSGFDQNLNGRDNSILSGILHGISRKQVESRLDEIQAYSELGDYFYEPYRTYSTGMRARLGFAITTIISPDVLLVDEVLGVGDASFRKKAEQTMIDKVTSNQTVVLVSHAKSMIERLCDRVILLSDGSGIATGNPGDVMPMYDEIVAKG